MPQARVTAADDEVVLRVCGRVEVWSGQGWATPASTISRAVLATLALGAEAGVAVETLYHAVWGDRPVASPRAAVQVAVHRLRAWLVAQRCPVSVRTTGTGYLLDLHGASTDLGYARQCAGQARQGPPEHRLELLAQALATWRAAPLADDPVLAGRLGPVVTPLAGEWRTLVLECGQAAILAGEPDRAGEIAELLVAADPFDESAAALVMQALDAAGRPAAAVQAYERLRALLADELGIDPGQPLREVYLRVVRQAGTGGDGDAGTDGTGAAPVPGPCLLPAQAADFTGRGTVLAELAGWLDADAPPPTVITGAPGVGKTVLAVALAHRLRDRYPGGQLFANLRGGTEPVPAEEVLAWFLRAVGGPGTVVPVAGDERVARFRAYTARYRCLVVLDDAGDEAQVRPLLGATGTAVLVTSRRPLPGLEAARRLELAVFAGPVAAELLARVAGPARVAAEPGPAQEIVRLCGYLPLAVRVSAARLAARPHWSLARLATALADERQRLDQLRAGDLDVRAAVTLSYRQLGGTAQRALRLLGLLDTADFPGWLAGTVLGRPTEAGEAVLEELVDSHLLGASGPDAAGQVRYRFHDLIRLYARERAAAEDSPAACRAGLAAALGGWVGRARDADARLSDRRHRGPDSPLDFPVPAATGAAPPDPTAWFEAEHAALMAGVRQAVTAGLVVHAWELVRASWLYLELVNNGWEQVHLARPVLAATRRHGDRRGEAHMLLLLAEGVHMVNRYGEALAAARQALATFAGTGDEWGQAGALFIQAQILEQTGEVPAAFRALARALRLYRRAGDIASQGRTLTTLGRWLDEYRASPRAGTVLRRGLDLLRAAGDRRELARGLRRAGLWHERHGRVDQALSCYRECLDLITPLHDVEGQAYLTYQLGALMVDRPDLGDARGYLTDALKTLRRLDDTRGIGRSLHAMGRLELRDGDPVAARGYLLRALSLLRGVPRLAAGAQRDLGDAYLATGNAPAAAREYQAARAAFTAIGDARAAAEVGRRQAGLPVPAVPAPRPPR